VAYRKPSLPSHSGRIIVADRLAETQRMRSSPIIATRAILILIWLAVLLRSAWAMAF
jgi:hypothetical protein